MIVKRETLCIRKVDHMYMLQVKEAFNRNIRYCRSGIFHVRKLSYDKFYVLKIFRRNDPLPH